MLVPAAPRAPRRSRIPAHPHRSSSDRTVRAMRTASIATPGGQSVQRRRAGAEPKSASRPRQRASPEGSARVLRRRLLVHRRRLGRGRGRIHLSSASPTSSPRSAGRSIGSPSRASSGRGTTRPLRLTVLAHEATHLRGIRNEAETECYALQEGVALGRALGLDQDTARALMRGPAGARPLRRERRTTRLPPARGVQERRLARPAAERPRVSVASPFRRLAEARRPTPTNAGACPTATHHQRRRLASARRPSAPGYGRSSSCSSRRRTSADARSGRPAPRAPPWRARSPRARSAHARSRGCRARRRSPSARVPPTPRSPQATSQGLSGRLGDPGHLGHVARDRPRLDCETLRFRTQRHLIRQEQLQPLLLPRHALGSICHEDVRPSHRPLGSGPCILACPPRALDVRELPLGLDGFPPSIGLSRLRLDDGRLGPRDLVRYRVERNPNPLRTSSTSSTRPSTPSASSIRLATSSSRTSRSRA